MTENKFSSGIYLASFVTSSRLLKESWDVIKSRKDGIVSSKWKELSWNVYKEPNSTLTIIAFEYPYKKEEDPRVSFNNTAISLLEDNRKLWEFVSEVPILFKVTNHVLVPVPSTETYHELCDYVSTQLIVTGHGFGGFVASLFTSSLLNSNRFRFKKNSVLCITFGSPLIAANKELQQDLSNSNFSFLHVVSLQDSLPWLYQESTLRTSAYMPSGIFLFCSDESDLIPACFENPESVLEFLKKMGPTHMLNEEFQYGEIVENLYRKAIYKDITTLRENITHPESNSVLAISISLQLRALFPPNLQQQVVDNINSLEKKMIELDQKFYYERREKFSSSTELNELKICMAKLELYKKKMKDEKIGYYDGYKKNPMDSCNNRDDLGSPTVIEIRKRLTNYWKKMVEEVKMKPQREGAAFRTRELYAGTNYRRMVEPLAIAEYYREGGRSYITERHEHFAKLEQWLGDETSKGQKSMVNDISNKDSGVDVNKNQDTEEEFLKVFEDSEGFQIGEELINKLNSYKINVNISDMVDNNISSTRKRNVEPMLTFDSCFWAHVEEALISLENLDLLDFIEKHRYSLPLLHTMVKEERKSTLDRLVEFENKVYELLKKYEVSPEIFLPESTYMHWWKKYKKIKGTSYDSNLAIFMNDEGNYKQYALGNHDFK